MLRLSLGDVITLDRGVVMGRNPRADFAGADGEERPHVVKLPSADGDISRTHLRVTLDGWHVLVTDLNSTNGTLVTLPGRDPQQLRPGEPMPIQPGTVVTLADGHRLPLRGNRVSRIRRRRRRRRPTCPGTSSSSTSAPAATPRSTCTSRTLPHRKVAVKVLNESALSEAARRRFTAEANVTAGLAHRHIVQVFDANVTADGRPYLVMPYYPQPNLSVRARRSHFSVADVLRIGIQIGSAVETSHRHDVLHRDIKPQNILTDSVRRASADRLRHRHDEGRGRPRGPVGAVVAAGDPLRHRGRATSAPTSTRSVPRCGTCWPAGRRSSSRAATTARSR